MRSYTRTRRTFAAATALSAALFLGACSEDSDSDSDDPDSSETEEMEEEGETEE